MVYKKKNIPGDKRGMFATGRPPILKDRTRLDIYVSKEEYDLIMHAAHLSEMSASALVRRIVLDVLKKETEG